MPFLTFMASAAGGVTRVVAGIGLIVIGVLAGGHWIALAVIGIVPPAAGAFDGCLSAPPARVPFAGKPFRESTCQT